MSFATVSLVALYRIMADDGPGEEPLAREPETPPMQAGEPSASLSAPEPVAQRREPPVEHDAARAEARVNDATPHAVERAEAPKKPATLEERYGKLGLQALRAHLQRVREEETRIALPIVEERYRTGLFEDLGTFADGREIDGDSEFEGLELPPVVDVGVRRIPGSDEVQVMRVVLFHRDVPELTAIGNEKLYLMHRIEAVKRGLRGRKRR